ncbi:MULTISPECIES: aspartate aminotransferase family protein [unclassified Mycolicibacterium]|uniref:aspartate aminotransferase family protein n=2 Tax=Mycolicibacterium TaxID=1866885 RepID=UPI0012DCC925|nr:MULTISPECIES: aminotransferase class III-fold pyridoxal phosphate-dependent enzyme [unclassified Mycolicibacterium]MUL83541.1 aminotransferase class III-fold pyridoxal phosphate-dependent enzyme [Mycolicibacterium sp. CBMA 329]MUL90532.1 aminotransferase class III-fold pyridoxal phosphate-dependent enzyme [Mycolicibacterium sp. CBMA 331]MUM00504.1 aminotransferase class III-fold pyridoxal phosphate-dependent enzyme [Mycolicibacterium sp. CBMA 334]MUM41476.1 aminotransferase class III-fold py
MIDDSILLKRRFDVLGRNTPLFYDEPVHLVRGEGVWVEDAAGRRYLDAYNNVPHVGHSHPHVVDAIARQSATLNLHTRYLHEMVIEYAERLTATFAKPLDTAMFTCSGTEANELALRMARFATGNSGVIVSDFSYHGNSATLAALTTAFPVVEQFPSWARTVVVPDPTRDRHGASDRELADRFAAHVADAVRSLTSEGYGVAAILIDTFFANEGLPDPVDGFVAKAVDIVREAGGLFICDEVQAGFARTGDAMWGHQLSGVIPDIVTLGKPMGNGYPLAGAVSSNDLMSDFQSASTYFNTFGGNPVAAAAGMAVLDVLEHQQLRENAREVGQYVRTGLNRLRDKHSVIGGVRGRGLFFGIELIDDTGAPAADVTKRLVNMMRDRGVLLSRIGRYDNVLKMRPPLVFDTTNADLLLSVLDDALSAL